MSVKSFSSTVERRGSGMFGLGGSGSNDGVGSRDFGAPRVLGVFMELLGKRKGKPSRVLVEVSRMVELACGVRMATCCESVKMPPVYPLAEQLRRCKVRIRGLPGFPRDGRCRSPAKCQLRGKASQLHDRVTAGSSVKCGNVKDQQVPMS